MPKKKIWGMMLSKQTAPQSGLRARNSKDPDRGGRMSGAPPAPGNRTSRNATEKGSRMNVASSPIDYSRKWYVMAAVAMSIFLATIDGSIVTIALPTLVRDLNTNFATIQWVLLAYLLTLTTLMLGIGRLADIRGKKPIYVSGFVVFTLGSVLCALAPTVYWLIGFRILQAVGGAMVLALGAAIVTEAFPPQERGKALGTDRKSVV